MKFYYYDYQNTVLKAFCEDGETIYSVVGNEPIAIVDEDIWYDLRNHRPIAVEEGKTVYSMETRKPIFTIVVCK